jgi:predicted Zn finger-like uncharacterized protein
MFTVCPKCALTLVVTAADLRVAQGYVRCGRCSSVFNALARLSEDRGAPAAAEVPGAATEESTPAAPGAATTPPAASEPAAGSARAAGAAQESEGEAIPEKSLEFDPNSTDLNEVFVQPPPNPEWTAATGSFKALIAANQDSGPELPDSQVDVEMDEAFLASMLRTDSQGPATAKPGAPALAPAAPVPDAARAPAPPPAAAAAPAERPAPRPPARHGAAHARPAAPAAKTEPPAPRPKRAAPAVPPATARTPEESAPSSELADELVEELAPESPPPASAASGVPALLMRHAWTIGAALAAFALAVQIVNHYRDDLAVNARFNRPLTALYGAFGVKLFPHWDLNAYDVRRVGDAEVDAGGGGLITVRASIKNSATQPQPLPLLRITFQDRFGNRVAARDEAPKSYLPRNVPATSFLSAGQRIDAEMGFADPGTDAVGFEIDACLPARGGGVACVNDAALR